MNSKLDTKKTMIRACYDQCCEQKETNAKAKGNEAWASQKSWWQDKTNMAAGNMTVPDPGSVLEI